MTTDTLTIHSARLAALEKRVDELERSLALATKPMLSMTEAATLLGISRMTLYERIKPSYSHPLPTRQWGGRQVVLRTDLEAWLASLPRAEP